MINQIPDPNKAYTFYQANIGDSLASGNIWSSMNLDLETNRGVMRVSGRMISSETTATEVLLTSNPVSIISCFGDYYMIAGGRIFKTAGLDPDNAWSEDTGAGYITTYDDFDSDLAVFDGKLWASSSTGWMTKTSATGSWTNTTANPNAGMTEYFRRTDRLYIVQNQDDIESIDDAGAFVTSGDYTISLTQATDNTISCLASNTDSMWIGTNNNKDDVRRASVFRWDGVSQQVSEIYHLKSTKVYSMVILNDIPYCFDNHGVLSKFTGSTFEEVGRIPMFNGSGENDFPVGSQESFGGNMAMHFNGMTVTKSGTILCLIRNLREDSIDSIPENSPSGIWEWSTEFGFVHKHGFSYTPRDSTTVTDWGQNRVGFVGALFSADAAEDSSNRNGTILAGVELWTDATTRGLYGIYYNDYRNFVQKKGYFVTTWIDSLQIQDKWERIWSVYRKFTESSDSIVLKYRTSEEDPVEATITWVDTTSFTTTTDISAYGNGVSPFNAEQGGEVEITRGIAGGLCAHITNISESGGVYTVTIDETATGATTTTGTARFQKWIKVNPKQEQDTNQEFSQGAVGANSTSIQVKCCMTFTGTNKELTKLALVSNEDIVITP